MAESTPETASTSTSTSTAKSSKPVVADSVYSAEEFAANAKSLDSTQAEVRVALRLAGKSTATLFEAKRIVDAFKKKEV